MVKIVPCAEPLLELVEVGVKDIFVRVQLLRTTEIIDPDHPSKASPGRSILLGPKDATRLATYLTEAATEAEANRKR